MADVCNHQPPSRSAFPQAHPASGTSLARALHTCGSTPGPLQPPIPAVRAIACFADVLGAGLDKEEWAQLLKVLRGTRGGGMQGAGSHAALGELLGTDLHEAACDSLGDGWAGRVQPCCTQRGAACW